MASSVTLKERVIEELRSRLLAHEWAAGTRLIETNLAESFGVSRGPIRDAVLALTKEGYLRMTPNCGVTVAGFPDSKARAIYLETRKQLEVLALEGGQENWTEDAFAAMEQLLERFELALIENDLPTVIHLDISFNRSIVEKFTEEDLLIVWAPLMKTIALPYLRHDDPQDTYREHEQIYLAIRKGDIAKASDLIQAHIQ